AEELGAEVVKIFPAEQVGGPKFVESIKGPCPWTNIMPTGGVEPTEENLSKWFKSGVFCVGMGSQLITRAIIENSNYLLLTQKVVETMALIRDLKAKNQIA
ncbi:MAG TPA: hypothetical protein VN182_05985, partial [Flavobacterium sp.]|nr:hypothetical protein [Flavobacterium sp.]